MHNRAVTKHTVADNATTIEVEAEEGMIPVAIHGDWTGPATFTLGLLLSNSGMPGVTDVYKATDDGAVTLADDKWTTIPEAMARKIAAVLKFQITLNAAETGGPMTVMIAWAPLQGV